MPEDANLEFGPAEFLTMAVALAIVGLALNLIEAFGAYRLKGNWGQFHKIYWHTVKRSGPAYIGLCVLAILVTAINLAWPYKDAFVVMHPNWFIVPIALLILGIAAVLIFRQPFTRAPLVETKTRTRRIAAVIKLVGIAVVWYELNWIVAVGLFLWTWGGNMGNRLNVLEELVEQGLIESESHK